ncbi:MAG: adenylosuccinate lyase [Candidatus Aminicenantes bacterium]|jgi:adenylosuccinate lyase|nr:adenylosuccinate lyase [Candidatus Aminicenantes bacterium]
MIRRYTREEMGSIWTDQNRYQKWLDVELAVCEAWQELGEIPPKALERIRQKIGFSVERIEEIERVVKHDVLAFLHSVAEHVGDDSRYIHLGLTSYDVVDTALSLLIRESLERIAEELESLRDILKDQALKHKKTPVVGRTHGVHAEPITFGVKVLVWYEEAKRHLQRIQNAIANISVGRISGSVGTYIHLDPRLETMALQKLGLEPAKVSTQVLQRDRHAEALFVLALICSSVEKFAMEIRHLQRTEVLEVEEPFTKGQKGSSSMPHKKNPVRAERISGLARVARANLQVALENIPLWHERDISHSSAERVIFPDSFVITDFLLAEASDLIKNWTVHPDKMEKNIHITKGLIFSQRVLLALTKKEISREQAYQLVQKNSLKAWNENLDFKDLIHQDPEIAKTLSEEEINGCFTLDPYLEKIDYIFDKVFSDED